MQEEAPHGVPIAARLLDVVQLAVVDVQIELRARRRLAGCYRSIPGIVPCGQAVSVVEEQILVLRRKQGVRVYSVAHDDEPSLH